MTDIALTIFELTGMPSDTDPEGQNVVINNSITELGWIHMHQEDEFGNMKYYLVQRKVYEPVGCESIRELDDVLDKDIIDDIMQTIHHVADGEEF